MCIACPSVLLAGLLFRLHVEMSPITARTDQEAPYWILKMSSETLKLGQMPLRPFESDFEDLYRVVVKHVPADSLFRLRKPD